MKINFTFDLLTLIWNGIFSNGCFLKTGFDIFAIWLNSEILIRVYTNMNFMSTQLGIKIKEILMLHITILHETLKYIIGRLPFTVTSKLKREDSLFCLFNILLSKISVLYYIIDKEIIKRLLKKWSWALCDAKDCAIYMYQ